VADRPGWSAAVVAAAGLVPLGSPESARGRRDCQSGRTPRHHPADRRELPQAPPQRRACHLPDRQPRRAAAQTPLPRHHPQQRLAQEPHRRPELAQPHQPRPGPPERSMGTGLTAWQSRPGRLAACCTLARLAEAGPAATSPARNDLAYCRTGGLAAAPPVPDHPLFRALLAAIKCRRRAPSLPQIIRANSPGAQLTFWQPKASSQPGLGCVKSAGASFL
jgi:hypothetical protein